MKHEEEYREVASKCDTQYKKNSINWAECINAGFREISGYPAEDDEEFAGSNELGCYLFPQAQVCRQRRLQRSNNNDDDDEEFAGSNELGCHFFPQAPVCQRRLQRSNNNDDDDEEFAGSNELGCYLFPQAQVCR
jgi:hypothetical protein